MLGTDDLLTQKIEVILDMNSKKVLSEFAKLHQEIAELKAEVEELKKRQRQAAAEPAPQAYQQPYQQAYPQQGPPQGYGQQGAQQPPTGWQPRGIEAAQPAKIDRPIDRNGVAPADVDIEKMFYFGNKKK